MKIKLKFVFLFQFINSFVFAQHIEFVTSGIIEYQKSANTFALLKKIYGKTNNGVIQQAFEQYQRTQPQFKVIKSQLFFQDKKTLYMPAAPENAVTGLFGFIPMADQNNLVYSDLLNNQSISQKKIFENIYIVKDSTRKINWKYTSETREIAGFFCRRANAIIMDSIYVVAFYTDKIPVSGGPESFTGLPGMILEIALPHENVSWIATKVIESTIPANRIKPPAIGKTVTNKELELILRSAMKNRDDNLHDYTLKAFFL